MVMLSALLKTISGNETGAATGANPVLGLNNVANEWAISAPEPAHRLRIISDDLVRIQCRQLKNNQRKSNRAADKKKPLRR
jgi:hypothetical protein